MNTELSAIGTFIIVKVSRGIQNSCAIYKKLFSFVLKIVTRNIDKATYYPADQSTGY